MLDSRAMPCRHLPLSYVGGGLGGLGGIIVPTFGVMLVLGVLIGSYGSAKLRHEFKLEGFKSPREFGEHVLRPEAAPAKACRSGK